MTNAKRYDKIQYMTKHFSKTICAAFAAVIIILAALSAVIFSGGKTVHAQDAEINTLLPASPIEYTALSSPTDACYYNGNYAVIERQTIRVFKADGNEIILSGFQALKQIKFLDDNTLYASDNGIVYAINLTGLQENVDISGNSSLKEQVASGSFFDFNTNYLITVYGNNLFIYTLPGLSPVSATAPITNANDSYPIAINTINEIFYNGVSDDDIKTVSMFKCSVDNTSTFNGVTVNDSRPDKMTANNQYIYFVSSGEVYRLSTAFDAAPQQLVLPESGYDLGNLDNPTGISFRGENLLITDAYLNAVQEFSPQDGALEFTGFAIASGKTAYNRIAANAKDIERYGDTVAVLDQNKLTVINTGDGFDTYAPESFINLFAGDDQSAPEYFALGNGTLLYATNTEVYALSLSDGELTGNKLDFVSQTAVKDICYQSGYYYLLTADGLNSYVYKIDESDFSLYDQAKPIPSFNGELIAADVFGNLYIADQNTIRAYKSGNENFESYARNGADKLCCDLAGVLFGVIDGDIQYYSNGWKPLNIPQSVKSFAIAFDRNRMYYIADNSEYVYYAVSAGNLSVEDAEVPEGFLARQAGDTLKTLFYTVEANANLYAAEYSGANFAFTGLSDPEEEYVFIDSITLTSITGTNLTLYALAGQNGVILADGIYVQELNKPLSSAPKEVYTATGVNLYYIPIITAENAFTALNGTDEIRFEKGVRLEVYGKLEFLGISFYSVSVQTEGGVKFGFVPESFTAEVLTEDITASDYSIKNTFACDLYADRALTEKIVSLPENTEVRLLSEEDGICMVAYFDGEQFVTGYVRASDIKDEAKTTVRNVLIVLAVLASVCGTATYFILRKKTPSSV